MLLGRHGDLFAHRHVEALSVGGNQLRIADRVRPG